MQGLALSTYPRARGGRAARTSEDSFISAHSHGSASCDGFRSTRRCATAGAEFGGASRTARTMAARWLHSSGCTQSRMWFLSAHSGVRQARNKAKKCTVPLAPVAWARRRFFRTRGAPQPARRRRCAPRG